MAIAAVLVAVEARLPLDSKANPFVTVTDCPGLSISTGTKLVTVGVADVPSGKVH